VISVIPWEKCAAIAAPGGIDMAEMLGDEPIQKEFHELMNDIAGRLDQLFNGEARGKDRNVGFVLLVFPYGEKEGRCNYISNGANREDVAKLLEEQAKRFRE